MQVDFPYVTVPERLNEIIGEVVPNTRTYRAYGKEEDINKWFDAVWEVCEPDMAVSPGGVSMFVKVSRAGVHKAIKEGRLTAFCFYLMEDSKFLKGKQVPVNGKRPYCYIPVVECRAWANRLDKIRDKKALDCEVNGDGDWYGESLDIPKDWKKKVKKKK